MKLPKLAVENHQFTVVIILLLVLSGVFSFLTMPRYEDPQIQPPGTSVIAVYPGATPTDIEELLIDPLEEVINELDDIKEISSIAEDGLMVIGVEFQSGSNPDDKYEEVLQKVSSIQTQLPEDVTSLEVIKHEINTVKILQLALASDSASYRTMEKEAERLKKQLERVAGVRKIETWAFPEQEVRVSLELEKMAQLNISLKQVINAIESASANIPGGNINIGSRRFNIKTSGSYQSLADIRNTIVHSANGKVVYLRDIANIDLGYEDKQYFARFNERRAIFITATQKTETNIFQVMEALKARVEAYKSQLPGSMSLHYAFDQSESVAHRVNGFFSNLLQGVVLVGIVVLIAMGFRSAIIVMVVIPLSIFIALGFLDLSQYGLQQMTIAGLIIALGLLVDNAIVVSENVARFLRQGYSRREAAFQGTSQIGWAVVSSTATTVLAFLPMIMIQNVTGDFIRSMPVMVIYALLASLFVSLTLTPFLVSKFLKTHQTSKIGLGQQLLQKFIEARYRPRLARVLPRPKLVLGIAMVVFLGSLALFPIIGVSFFPKAEKPQFVINIDAPEGTSIYKTEAIAAEVEAALSQQPQVSHFATNIGRGNPRIYYNVIPKNEKGNHAQILVQLRKYDLEAFNRVIGSLREKFANFPGAEIKVKEFEQGPPVEAPIAIRILGEDLRVLRDIAHDVEKMIATTNGTLNLNNPLRTRKTDLHVNINRDKAAMLGIPLVDIDRTVRAGITGLPIASYRDDQGKEYDIVVRLPVNETPKVTDFNKIYLASYSGAQVPLKQVSKIEFKTSPLKINHYNLQRSVTLTADVESEYAVNDVTGQVINQLRAYDFPRGYRYSIGGEQESRQESFGGMAKAVMIALIAIFAVLVLQFRSFSQPLIVFSAIPLAVIGSIIALLITGYSFSFTAFVGITSLVGIVINNSIILVDYTNQLYRRDKDLLSALKEACETRFTPIILTTATTIGGLLPLTLGGGTMWAPMGWTIIGGLLASTMLTLIVVPVLYKIFTPKLNV